MPGGWEEGQRRRVAGNVKEGAGEKENEQLENEREREGDWANNQLEWQNLAKYSIIRWNAKGS